MAPTKTAPRANTAAAVAILGLALAGADQARAVAVSSAYVGPVAGDWKDPGNWSNSDGSTRFPDGFSDTFEVTVAPAVPSTVSLIGAQPGAAAINLGPQSPGATALTLGPEATVVVDTLASFRDGSLQIDGDIVNDGTIVLRDLDPAGGSRNLSLLRFRGVGRQLTGTGRVVFDTANQNIIDHQAAGVATSLEIGSGQTITTSAGALGSTGITFANHGTIEADAGTIVLGQGNLGANSNTGRIAAVNGGTVEIAWELQNAGGTIEAGAGSEVHQRAIIEGGTIRGDGILRTTSNAKAILDSVTLDTITALVQTSASGTASRAFKLRGPITNNGTIRLDDLGTGTGGASLIVDGAVTVDGIGEIVFDSPNKNVITCRSSPCTFAPFGTLTLGAGQTTRVGTGDAGRLAVIVDNQGTMRIDGTLVHTLAGSSTVSHFVNSGTITGTGRVDVTGQFGFRNDGRVAPGDGTGQLIFESGYQQSAAGTLAIELGGPVFDLAGPLLEYDRLAVEGGPARLDGLLEVSLAGGFAPLPTDVFTILTATDGVIGRFANTPGDVLTFGQGRFDVVYGADFVQLAHFTAAPAGVPEPSSPMLVLTALAALARRGRRIGAPASRR